MKSTTYTFRVVFRAPLRFAFRWCTDYSPEDAKLEGEDYQRRIVKRTRTAVVYEDLTDTPEGWMWSRNTVSLLPPNRWHADMNGNHRTWTADYTLKTLPGDRTELRFRGKRTPTALGERNPPQKRLQRELELSWKQFARHMERDYRAGRGQKGRRVEARQE